MSVADEILNKLDRIDSLQRRLAEIWERQDSFFAGAAHGNRMMFLETKRIYSHLSYLLDSIRHDVSQNVTGKAE